jgi:hypothetical protein
MSWLFSVSIVLSALAAAMLLRADYDRLLRRFAFAKRRDRPVENRHFVLVVVPLLAVEITSFELLGHSWRTYWPIVAFWAYIPLNFMFMCNVFVVGAHREAAWICGAGIACLSSLLVSGELKLEWVLVGCILFTVAICIVASRDPYSYYRIGLRYLDEKDQHAKGLLWLERAHSVAPGEVRYLYHLGRANLESGQRGIGARMMKEALRMDPAFPDTLRTDPLFYEKWIPPDSPDPSPRG